MVCAVATKPVRNLVCSAAGSGENGVVGSVLFDDDLFAAEVVGTAAVATAVVVDSVGPTVGRSGSRVVAGGWCGLGAPCLPHVDGDRLRATRVFVCEEVPVAWPVEVWWVLLRLRPLGKLLGCCRYFGDWRRRRNDCLPKRAVPLG